jgi:hypothetical protein
MDINRPYFGQEPVHEGKIAVHGREFVFTEWILAGNYGMRVWPCSVILSEELAKEKWNKVSVCELGAGLGLPGMLLSTLGADVTFIEKDRICCDWLKMTLYHNKVNGKVVFCDWSEYNGDTFDSIVGSEIVYIDDNVASLAYFIHKYWNRKLTCRFVVSLDSYINSFVSKLESYGLSSETSRINNAFMVTVLCR